MNNAFTETGTDLSIDFNEELKFSPTKFTKNILSLKSLKNRKLAKSLQKVNFLFKQINI